MKKISTIAFLTLNLLLIMTIEVDGKQSHMLTLIKKYYECNNYFKMKNDSESHQPVNEIDDSIPNNFLDSSFFLSLGLGNMTFDQGMEFIRKIYLDVDNCTSELCKCVDLDGLEYIYKYSLFFRNQSNFLGVKSIISEFNKKYNNKNYLKPLTNIIDQINNSDDYYHYNYVNSTKDLNFYLNVDYTDYRLDFYNKKYPSCYIQTDEKVKFLKNKKHLF